MIKRVVFLIIGVIVLTLLVTSVALAWTPQDIYDDYVQHGKLTRDYTEGELQAFQNDATLHQYGNHEILTRLDTLVEQLLSRPTFPFTGFQMMIGVFVVVAVIGGGTALWALSRPRQRRSLGS